MRSHCLSEVFNSRPGTEVYGGFCFVVAVAVEVVEWRRIQIVQHLVAVNSGEAKISIHSVFVFFFFFF